MNGGKIAELVEWATPAEPRRSTFPERTAELPPGLSEFSKRQDRYTDRQLLVSSDELTFNDSTICRSSRIS